MITRKFVVYPLISIALLVIGLWAWTLHDGPADLNSHVEPTIAVSANIPTTVVVDSQIRPDRHAVVSAWQQNPEVDIEASILMLAKADQIKVINSIVNKLGFDATKLAAFFEKLKDSHLVNRAVNQLVDNLNKNGEGSIHTINVLERVLAQLPPANSAVRQELRVDWVNASLELDRKATVEKFLQLDPIDQEIVCPHMFSDLMKNSVNEGLNLYNQMAFTSPEAEIQAATMVASAYVRVQPLEATKWVSRVSDTEVRHQMIDWIGSWWNTNQHDQALNVAENFTDAADRARFLKRIKPIRSDQ